MAETIKVTVAMVLTSDFFNELALLFNADNYTSIYNLIYENRETLANTAKYVYEGLLCRESTPYQTVDIVAQMVYADMGQAFAKIYDALTTDYNPYENYFTDRTMSDNLNGNTTRDGGYTDTPTGTKVRTYTDAGNIGQGTTFDDSNTWRNINKTTSSGSINDGFSGYSETRSYNNLKDTAESDREVTEQRSGNSGIFSKQDLLAREIKARLNYRVIPILVRMCVDYINKGVWDSAS